ncbi:hypothetical protein FLACOL7796_04256 [Flavobacterium collinsii]|uniref:Uncharacterized protein n=1 Tax=Flavobacterium collinsii TaxID=1114861 RepID=A0ABM8KP01_9FLAO|nr:hypothetical protein FLACOL7796_04256 [Flavobacterium collinsii]
MVFNFKILFFTLISCCYLNTVFEFSDNEERLNFEKETHSYISQNTLKLDIPETTTQKKVVVVDSYFFSEITFYPVVLSKTTTNNYQNNFSPPPQRRYILYASLLI